MSDFMLTSENYYSKEANEIYMSSSQFKAFRECEAAALAQVRGETTQTVTSSMLIGAFVDAYFEGTIESFYKQHPEIFKADGTLKVNYLHAYYIIARIESQAAMMHFFSGEKQKVLTGEISGVPFKVKIDSFLSGEAIVDGKVMADFKPKYKEECGRVPWYEYWGYDTQGAIYQEVVRQNYGDKLDFILNAATKETEPDLKLLRLPQYLLDYELSEVQDKAPRYDAIKKGIIPPLRCECCDYCKRTRIVILKDIEEEISDDECG